MKKLFILFFSLAVLVSCSSDDDNAGEDPILGTWIIVESSIFNVDDCEQESIITFNQNKTASGTFYLGNFECAPQNSTGEWENLGNSRYRIEVPVAGDLEGTATFSDNNNFIFTTGLGSFTFERQ